MAAATTSIKTVGDLVTILQKHNQTLTVELNYQPVASVVRYGTVDTVSKIEILTKSNPQAGSPSTTGANETYSSRFEAD